MTRTPPKQPRKMPGAVRRRAVGGTAERWVEAGPLVEGQAIPWVVRPAAEGVDLEAWARDHRAQIDAWLDEHRALLFRGFGIGSVPEFERVIAATTDGETLEYRDRTTPRTTEGNNVYTATVHPADQRINLHNEGTYWLRWAKRLYFCCLTAPEQGGETPLADVRKVHDRIDPDLRQRFADRRWMLVRNYNDGFGLRWQEVFQTEDRAEVEAFCRANRIEYEWKDGDRLRTRQVRPAVRKHWRTGEPVWFNHVAFYHNTSLEPSTREALLAEFGEQGLPYNALYGDGSPIEPEIAEHLRAAYAAEKRVFPWHEGDVTLIDNMSVAHAREPYRGDRMVLVAMTDPVDGDALS